MNSSVAAFHPKKHLSAEKSAEELLSLLEEQKDTNYFLQRKFNVLLGACLFLIALLSMLYLSEKAENDLRADLLNHTYIRIPNEEKEASSSEESSESLLKEENKEASKEME
jgi:hypothetical protein